MQAGLMAGWLAKWPADEIWVNFKIFKFVIDHIFEFFAAFNKSYSIIRVLRMHLSWYF